MSSEERGGTKTKCLEVPIFSNPKTGSPTCASNWQTGDVCPFLLPNGAGFQQESCWWSGHRVFRDDSGFLVPNSACPLWSSKSEGGDAA